MTTRIEVGEITIDRIVEQEGAIFEALKFFPTLTEQVLGENTSWLAPTYFEAASGKLIFAVQSFLVRTPNHTILVDSCVGNHKPRPAHPFWNMLATNQYQENLAKTGATVHDIDYIMCTHLHIDHVGWNTRLQNGCWVPTFPKAKYLFADRELQHWTTQEQQNQASCPWITDSVLPIIAAGQAEVVKSNHTLEDLVHLVPTPGHTIDHYSVHVGEAGQDAFITGDMIHSPLQARYPELGMRSDYDSAQAGATRRRVFEQFCDSSTLMCLAHFPSPSLGRVERWGEGFKIIPL